MNDVISFLKEDIKKYESDERYAHTLSVYDECMWYAEKMCLSDKETQTLGIAALLHDITKELPDGEAEAICADNNIKFSHAPTLHQDTAAPFIKKVYGGDPVICDKGVLSAVSKHTTGGDGMTVCDMVLFIADFTEATRKYENCVTAREYIHAECEKIKKNDRASSQNVAMRGVALICKMTIDYLTVKNRQIDQRTQRTYELMTAVQKE